MTRVQNPPVFFFRSAAEQWSGLHKKSGSGGAEISKILFFFLLFFSIFPENSLKKDKKRSLIAPARLLQGVKPHFKNFSIRTRSEFKNFPGAVERGA